MEARLATRAVRKEVSRQRGGAMAACRQDYKVRKHVE
jgi:hypothetical protein